MNRNATATILIVLAIGIYFTLTRGILRDIKAVQAVNAQYTSAISNAEQLISVREKVLKSYNGISQDDRDRLEKMIPDTVDNIRLIIDLTSVGVRHGFTLKNIKASASAAAVSRPTTQMAPSSPGMAGMPMAGSGGIPTPTLDTVTIGFDVVAPYLEFISFLQDLEANLRIMDISRLSVTTDDTGQYHFTVELRTYWLRQQ